MNREEYLEQLRQRNVYCKCPELVDLFKQKKKAKKLELICDRYRDESDFENPREGDEEHLASYLNKIEAMEEAYVTYGKMLTLGIERGLLKEKENTNDNQFKNHPVTTIQCGSCDQQIDIIA